VYGYNCFDLSSFWKLCPGESVGGAHKRAQLFKRSFIWNSTMDYMVLIT